MRTDLKIARTARVTRLRVCFLEDWERMETGHGFRRHAKTPEAALLTA
jgi:hypothetical protein